MFKTSFSKYLTAFIVIIFVSFAILSSIITSMVRNYVTDEMEAKLDKACDTIYDFLAYEKPRDIGEITDAAQKIVPPMVNLDSQYDVAIVDYTGKIVLTTAHPRAITSNGSKDVVIEVEDGIGTLDIDDIKGKIKNGHATYSYNGYIGSALKDQYMICMREIALDGEISGYILTFASNTRETNLVYATRRAVINGSIWVMVAAVIVAYFITARLVHPLKNMTSAAKKFAKGDFSVRVDVSGKHHDEVTELGTAFNNMAESLDGLEKMRNSFLANISHDLRTPMTTIAGFIDGINSGAIPPEKHEYYLGVISAEVHRLSRLVSQLLDVSKLESGERKFNYTDFDIAEVARLILISFEKKIDDKRLDVEFDSEFDEMYALADKDAIYQVLYNLCHNAVKFAREEGCLRISLSRVTDTKLKISVYDQGQTLTEEDMKMVFERFYKTDESRGLDKSGVGLGLYISKTIIDAHGETIGVNSTEDGCEFWFTLTEGTTHQKRKRSVEIDD